MAVSNVQTEVVLRHLRHAIVVQARLALESCVDDRARKGHRPRGRYADAVSNSTPAVRILSAFARSFVMSCGVLDRVTLVMTSSRTFQKPVTRADIRPRVASRPPSAARKPFRLERLIRIRLCVAHSESSIELVQGWRRESPDRPNHEARCRRAHDTRPMPAG